MSKDRGFSVVEFGALFLLVVVIAVALWSTGIVGRLAKAVADLLS